MSAQAKQAKQEALLQAAVATFLRYGWKKTSMDDVARAANVSRQGLYLHWTSKEALFKDAVVFFIGAGVDAAIAALNDDEDHDDVAAAVARGAVALHAGHFDTPVAQEHVDELLEAAVAVLGTDVLHAHQPFFDAVEKRLRQARVPRARERARVLAAACSGLKHSAASLGAYRAGVVEAVDLLVGADR